MKKLRKGIGILLSAAMLLTSVNIAFAEQYKQPVNIISSSAGENSVSTDQNNDYKTADTTEKVSGGTSAGDIQLFDNSGEDNTPYLYTTGSGAQIAFANGTPVVIKEDEDDGHTYMYNTEGTEKYLDGVYIDNMDVYGGRIDDDEDSSNDTVTGNTSVTIESGNVKVVFGGDLYTNRIGDTNITMTGGRVQVIYGGSRASSGSNAWGNITGNTNITMRGGQVNSIYGGGDTETSTVSGKATVLVTNYALVQYDDIEYTPKIMGGGLDGYVGSTDVTLATNSSPDVVVYGGGWNDTSRVDSANVTITGKCNCAYGAAYAGLVGKAVLNIESSVHIPDMFAGGRNQLSTTNSTELNIKGGCVGYVYGGGNGGKVTGNVIVNITGSMIVNSELGGIYIRGGGLSGNVGGNVDINITNPEDKDKMGWSLLTIGGFNGIVEGNGSINFYYNGTEKGFSYLSYLSGQSNNADNKLTAVEGTTSLNFYGKQHYYMWDLVENFDTTNIHENAEVEVYTQWEGCGFRPKDLNMSENSLLYINPLYGDMSVNVSGDFSGNGTINLQDGYTFGVRGQTSGVTTLIAEGATSGGLGGAVKLIDGENADLSNYVLDSSIQTHELKKYSDGIYAIHLSAVPISITTSENMQYGEKMSAKIEIGETTETGELEVHFAAISSSGEFCNQETKAVSNGEVTFDVSNLDSDYYVFRARLEDAFGNIINTAEKKLEIKKRKLTLDMSGVEPFTRSYLSGITDIKIPVSYFKNGTITGYLDGDSGAQLVDGLTYTFNFPSPDVGDYTDTAKPLVERISLLKYANPIDDAQAAVNKITKNYYLQIPKVKIAVTPVKKTQIVQVTPRYNYKYGQKLSDIALNGGEADGSYAWANGDLVPPIGVSQQTVVYTPGDTLNYDYSEVDGWNASEKTVTFETPVTVEKKDKPQNYSLSKSYIVNSIEQEQSIDLSLLPVFAEDAGEVSFAYSGESLYGDVSNIALDGKILSFTIAANANVANDAVTVFLTASSEYYKDTTVEIIISLADKTPVDITGVTVAAERIYDGNPAEYSGMPQTGAYAGELEYEWYDKNNQLLESAPVDAGQYKLVAKIPDTDAAYTGKQIVNFRINVKAIAITPKDISIMAGDNASEYTYEVSGLVSEDEISAQLLCAYVKDDSAYGVPGTYTITIGSYEFISGKASNYIVSRNTGVLTVNREYGAGYNAVTKTVDICAASNQSAEVYAAMYDEAGILKKVVKKNTELKASETVSIDVSELTENTSMEDMRIRVFVWTANNEMTPIDLTK